MIVRARGRDWGRRRVDVGGDVMDADGGGLSESDAAEVDARVGLVRVAKARKGTVCGDCDLTPRELDAVLPPVECRRTRIRRGREAAGRPASSGLAMSDRTA